MTASAFLLAIFAFVLFGLATEQHHGRCFRHPCPPRRALALRGAAWLCLAFDFALSLHLWGGVFGAIGWFATIMAGAALAFCALNFIPLRPRS